MKKIIKIIVFIILCGISVYFASQNAPVPAVIFGVLGSVIYSLFFEDVTNTFKAWLNVPIRTKKLTICLYGQGGSGKTTLIKRLLTSEDITKISTPSTKDIEYYEGKLYYSPDLTSHRRRFNRRYEVPVSIADYKGQDPNQALKLKNDFISQINTIIFITDVAHFAPEGNNLSDNELVDWLSSNTEERINYRVIQHTGYVGVAALNVLFTKIFSMNKGKLHTIRLVVNKIDIVEKLIAKGHLLCNSSTTVSASEVYLKDKFKFIEEWVYEASRQSGITDVKTNFVSFKYDTGVQNLIRDLISSHFDYLGIR